MHIYLKSAWILLKCWEEVVNSAVATAYECIHRTVIEGWVCVLLKTGAPPDAQFMDRALKSEHGGPKRPKSSHVVSVGVAAEFVFRIQESCEMDRVKQRALLIDTFQVGGISAFGAVCVYRFVEPKPLPYVSDFIVNIKTGDVSLRAQCWYFLYKPKPDPLIFSLAFFFFLLWIFLYDTWTRPKIWLLHCVFKAELKSDSHALTRRLSCRQLINAQCVQ